MIRNTTDSQKSKEQFINCGLEFSRRFSDMIPRFRGGEDGLLDKSKGVFFKDGGELQTWIFVENEKAIGRIGAMINPAINCQDGKLGMVGFFECEDNYDVALELLEVATGWLKSQNCTHVWGPMEFSIWHNYRFITEGFNEKPFLGEPRNPPYYPEFFKRFGFNDKFEWESRILDMKGINAMVDRYAEQYDIFCRLGYKIVKICQQNTGELMDIAYQLVFDSYKVFNGFSHMSKNDFLDLYSYVPRILDRNATMFIKSPEGEYVAFMLVVKDLTLALQAMRGETGLLAKLRFKLNENKSEYANFYQGGATISAVREAMIKGKKELGRPLSIGRAAMFYGFNEVRKSGMYNYAIFPLMREDAPNRNYSEGIYLKSRKYQLFEMKF